MTYWTEPQLASIHKMLNPRSIAVVGATERMQYGGRFLRSVMQAGDRVNIYPVNPRYDELLGLPCYPSVTDLPESPDAVGIIVPYHRVIPVLRESAEKGAGSGIVISAGFSERGVEERRQLQLRTRKRRARHRRPHLWPKLSWPRQHKGRHLGLFLVLTLRDATQERQYRTRLPERRLRFRSVSLTGDRPRHRILLHRLHWQRSRPRSRRLRALHAR